MTPILRVWPRWLIRLLVGLVAGLFSERAFVDAVPATTTSRLAEGGEQVSADIAV
jgi:hypothetical protein